MSEQHVFRVSVCRGKRLCFLPFRLLRTQTTSKMVTDSSLARSLKDTVKAINSAFSSQNVSGLPEELYQTLDDFLEKRQDQDSQRVQEELLAIYNKHVGQGSGKQNAFASLLRILLPSIAKQEWLDEWWSLIVRQTLDTIGNKRDNIEAVKELLLN